MVAHKKSFLAIFMAVLLGTGFIMQADTAQSQNTEKKDEFEGRGTQVPLDSAPESYIERKKVERAQERKNEIEASRKYFKEGIMKLMVLAAIFSAYHAARYAIVGPDMPYVQFELMTGPLIIAAACV